MIAFRIDRNIQWAVIIILGFIVVAGLSWVNYSFSKNNPGGYDFLIQYEGTRALLLDGNSPYGEEAAVRIQVAANGHSAQGNERQLRFSYPLYSVIFFAPFSIISNYFLARALWMTMLELSLITMTFISFRLVEWKPSLWLQALIILFSLTWYHAIRGVESGNTVILAALFISAILLLIKENRDQAAGLLMAITTIKPQLVLLLIFLILIWAVYQKRWVLIRWFFITLAVLVLVGFLLIPNWILQNLWDILKYQDYNPTGALTAVITEFIPSFAITFNWVIFIGLGILLIYEWWTGRKEHFSRLLWVAFLTLVISQWIGNQSSPDNFIIFFPSILLILSVCDKRWEKQGPIIIGSALGFLFVGLWVLFILTNRQAYQPDQNPIMFIPLPALTFLCLYWIKWWVIAPVRTILNESP
jgi:hypothetical protein